MTLVRDSEWLVPLQVAAGTRMLAVMPRPADFTPAGTSSLVASSLDALAGALMGAIAVAGTLPVAA
ncbi:MAG: hypothetical protein ABI534_02350 [Chloroflexota bacterium]